MKKKKKKKKKKKNFLINIYGLWSDVSNWCSLKMAKAKDNNYKYHFDTHPMRWDVHFCISIQSGGEQNTWCSTCLSDVSEHMERWSIGVSSYNYASDTVCIYLYSYSTCSGGKDYSVNNDVETLEASRWTVFKPFYLKDFLTFVQHVRTGPRW